MNNEELPNGRELDALISVEIMGVTVLMGTDIFDNTDVQENQPVPHYSTDDAQALKVAKRMIELGFEFALINDKQMETREYAAEFDIHGWNIGETTYINGERSVSIALAICRAALIAQREQVT